MSQTIITVERVNQVIPHPNADRLDVIQVLGYKVITGRDEFRVGDAVVYFPPDILLPPAIANLLGVQKYLKHSIFPGDTDKVQCRVAAARLRGIPSHGFVCSLDKCGISPKPLAVFGGDLTGRYGAHKYEPPVRVGAGDAAPELVLFSAYTNIENIQRYPEAFTLGEEVVITEKLHGTNCRLGVVWDNGILFVAGSHSVRRKEDKKSIYWQFMTPSIQEFLLNLMKAENEISGACTSVVIYGEIFGPSIQDLDYGQSHPAFRAFDIKVDGQFLDYADFSLSCQQFGIPIVPLLYKGLFSPEKVEEFTYGASTFKSIRHPFKDREGCVVKPTFERHSNILNGRLILKSVSADYRNRKNASDIGE